jgi:hypothetical protein
VIIQCVTLSLREMTMGAVGMSKIDTTHTLHFAMDHALFVEWFATIMPSLDDKYVVQDISFSNFGTTTTDVVLNNFLRQEPKEGIS